MSERSYYVITLKSKMRFVAALGEGATEIPDMVRLAPVLLDRQLLIHPSAIEAMAPCTEQEARKSAKSLNGKSMFHRYFGEVPIRMKM
ncbi:hypothetical protein CLV84_1279 [Neolewinella xylanilytica]|uniref:Uncharacterized protein n=1 Tax=Neolewinella xylanilytica TaxID=1514080 RepID=A0A2S6I9Y9_9BACT|nr:hypothetical protein [Neolewinella xylanilytica]PPK88314.1 hypothetical protein CLV84_1279 [Neolewinella xylanilytica]